MNLIILTGRLTKDTELKKSSKDKAYCRFSIAVDRPYRTEEVDFVNCIAFGKTAELVDQFFNKGKKIGVQGQLRMNKFEKDGEKRTSYDVVCDSIEFMDAFKGGSAEGEKDAPSKPASPSKPDSFDTDEEFPF